MKTLALATPLLAVIGCSGPGTIYIDKDTADTNSHGDVLFELLEPDSADLMSTDATMDEYTNELVYEDIGDDIDTRVPDAAREDLDTDSGVEPDWLIEETVTEPICQKVDDNQLTSEELPALKVMGAVAVFSQNKAGTTVGIPPVEGVMDEECGCRVWDFAAMMPSDEKMYDAVLPISSFWFKDWYPEGDFVQFFGNDSLGIYSLKTDGLFLLGLASVQEQVTAIVYNPPVKLLALPMKLGDAWKTDSAQATGLYEGEQYPLNTGITGTVSIEHSFHFSVDYKGIVKIPAGELPAWRVAVDLRMDVINSMNPTPVVSQRYKLLLWVSECTGLVVRIRSEEGEMSPAFKKATEYRRLGF